jgi:hypothetical protein
MGEWLLKIPQPFWLIDAAWERGGSILLEASILPHCSCVTSKIATPNIATP